MDSLTPLVSSIFSSQTRVFFIVCFLLLVATEIGFRGGLRLYKKHDEARKSQIGGAQGAVLGLLALLLGFTFSMALGRYEVRQNLVLQEANDIGTTYLRSSF